MLDAGRIAEALTHLPADEAELVEQHLREKTANQLRRARRDAAIRTAAAFWGELPPTKQAVELATALSRYVASTWRFDRHHGPPTQPVARALFQETACCSKRA